MKDWMNRILLVCCFVCMGTSSKASHLFGADLHYENVSGLTYKIILDVYGDCSGQSFPSLPNSLPQIIVYNNGTFYDTTYLSLVGAGVEVTPVCASQINNTTCNGGSIPGIKKFSYQGNVTLSGNSANWLFKFVGNMGNGYQAGRSASITNITGGTSIMCLQASLNNTSVQNSSVTYTTLPTPFFCINKPAQYNPGAVDPNNDSLSFALVSGLTSAGVVSYQSPYTAGAPLATQAGTFSTSNITGQVSFTPNLVQSSLIVSRVSEYKNGILVGTSMREMVFVVLSNCNNNPPGGVVSAPSGGTVSNNTSIVACQGNPNFNFHILPTDLDGDSISVATAGLPTGASVSVTGNNTIAPNILFSWNLTSVIPGTYVFYVTYTDNGCPLSSKQTVAYSIYVAPKPIVIYSLVSGATCVAKAVYSLYITGSSPYNLSVTQGSNIIQSTLNIGQNYTDSLNPGAYTINISDIYNCIRSTPVNILSPPIIAANYTISNVTCFDLSNGSISSAVTNGLSPYQYALGNGSFSSFSSFTGLSQGTYVYKIRDANFCSKDTTIFISKPNPINANYTITNLLCYGTNNGVLNVVASGGTSPYQYALGTGAFNSTATFTGLSAGSYVFKILDANNCSKDTLLTITTPPQLHLNITSLNNITCYGHSTGSFSVSASGGMQGYKFSVNGGSYSYTTNFTNLIAGNYLISLKDTNNCTHDTTITLTQPAPFNINFNITQPLCFDNNNGSVIVNVIGGTNPYQFAIDTNSFNNVNNFSGLYAGNYTIHIKDNNNCILDSTIAILQPAQLTIAYNATNPKCFGESTGGITVVGSGGTFGYSYSLNNNPFQANNFFNNLSAGNYFISIQDANSCKRDTNLSISQPSQLQISSFQIVNPTCEGYTDGSITITVNGGITPYSFNVNGNNFTANNTFSSLSSGNYMISIKDSNNCLKDTSITLKGYPPIYLDSLRITPSTCFGVNDGAITVYASGGNQPLTYVLNSGLPSFSNVFLGLSSIVYSIKIVDNLGCEKDSSAMIPSPKVMDLSFNVTNNDCIGADDGGAIGVVIFGGTYPYSYLWNNSTTNDSIFGLNNGNYYVVVTDAKGCIDTGFATVNYDDCCTVFVPTAFTPNNDSKNDNIGVLFKGDLVMKEFSIYNRFGQRVFTGINANDKWDGNFNGQPQELGTYYYYIKAICGYQQNKEKQFKGDFTLIR